MKSRKMNKAIWIFFVLVSFANAGFSQRSVEAVLANQQPINPNATPETVALYNYLLDNYGNQIISGQADLNAAVYVYLASEKAPKILCSDFMDYTQTTNRNMITEGINWVKKYNGIITYQWHWRNPERDENGNYINGGFYTFPERDNVHFNIKGIYSSYLAEADSFVYDTTSKEYADIVNDIDKVAGGLKVLQDAGVPVLWRPLHEAMGNPWGTWFWWGDQGPEACKALYRLIFDRMVNYHHLNNLIWVWTASFEFDDKAWYPGNEYVDIIGADIYGARAHWAYETHYQTLSGRYGSSKIYALSEVGVIPDPNELIISDIPWAYFVTWGGEFITGDSYNSQDFINETYNHPYVIVIDSIDAENVEPIAGAEGVKFEAEDANVVGLSITKNTLGYSGTGQVDFGQANPEQYLEFTVQMEEADSVELYMSYSINENWGQKPNFVTVNNGAKVEYDFNKDSGEWNEVFFGKVFLNKGSNTVRFDGSWGYFSVDYIKLLGSGVVNPQAKNVCLLKPSNFKKSNVGENSVDLEWDSEGELFEVAYSIRYSEVWKTISNVKSHQCHIDGLYSGNEYEVRVRAICSNEPSAWSLKRFFTTSGEPVNVCELEVPVVKSVTFTSRTRIEWESFATEFEVLITDVNTNEQFTNTVADHALSVRGLKEGTAFTVQIRTICGLTNSDWCTPVPFRTDGTNGLEGFSISDIKIYPNPTSGIIQTNLPDGELLLLNSTGQRIGTVQVQTGIINISHLQKGIYLLKNETNVFRVVKN